MPELPEVETLRIGIDRRLTGCRILNVRVLSPKMLKGSVTSSEEIICRLVNTRIDSVSRRGKYLIFALDSGYYLLLHLKMRGQLLIVPANTPDEKYLAVAIEVENHFELRFHDMWTWGEVRLCNQEELLTHSSLLTMGLEPLSGEWSAQEFHHSLARRPLTAIKAALLDQRTVAGVGNIYADESLFRASVQPTRRSGSLTFGEIDLLNKAVREVLVEAIRDGGTQSDNYFDIAGVPGSYIPRVYGREGKACINCGTALIRVKVSGRSSVYCPNCQH